MQLEACVRAAEASTRVPTNKANGFIVVIVVVIKCVPWFSESKDQLTKISLPVLTVQTLGLGSDSEGFRGVRSADRQRQSE